jgi:four helix bundle protein
MSAKVESYRDLNVWQRAMELVVDCYRLSRTFPDSERFGLTSQLQRAAVSVPANIAEGRGRRGTKDFLRHLSIAYGSLCETETHLMIAIRLEFINKAQAEPLLSEAAAISKMLNGRQASLRRKLPPE